MTVMDPPRHPLVQAAFLLARRLCQGHTIDDAPALRHAALVARTLVDHVPDAPAPLAAAALLHDSPIFAPPGTDLAALLATVGNGVAPLVAALHAQHQAMEAGHPAALPTDLGVIHIAAADKVIAFRSLRTRATRSGNPAGFWNRRTALQRLIPYFTDWTQLASPHLPGTLRASLHAELSQLRAAITASGTRP